MVTKHFCDVCKEEIPDTTTMEHNESTKHLRGLFRYQSGVLLHNKDELCGKCSLEVKEFIDKIKKEST